MGGNTDIFSALQQMGMVPPQPTPIGLPEIQPMAGGMQPQMASPDSAFGNPATLSNRIQQWLGAKPQDQGGQIQDILAGRFQPSMNDVGNAALQTLAGGKYVSPQTAAAEQLKAQLDPYADLAKIEYLGKGGGSGSVFAQTMEAINADPSLANLSMMDKIRLAQNKVGTNLTMGANGVVSDMTGAAQGLGNLAYGEKRGGETATQQVKQAYEPTTAGLVEDQKNISDINAAPKIKAGGEIGGDAGKQVTALRQSAMDAQDALYLNQQARSLLDKGVITGAGANGIAAFGAALKQVGLDFGTNDDVSNTQAFIASRAQAVGQKIKLFGSGTGLSDADRDYAQQMAAGKIQLTEQAIRKILDMDDKSSHRTIQRFNSQIAKVPQNLTPFNMDLPENPGVDNSLPSGAGVTPRMPGMNLGSGKPTDNDPLGIR